MENNIMSQYRNTTRRSGWSAFFAGLGEFLKAAWNTAVDFMDWTMGEGLDGIAKFAGVFFRSYDFLAGTIGMGIVGYMNNSVGSAILFPAINIILFFVNNKIMRGFYKKESWLTSMGPAGQIVIGLLLIVTMGLDSLVLDSSWVFAVFGVNEFFLPLNQGLLWYAFGQLSMVGLALYIASVIISAVAEYADQIFRGGSPAPQHSSQPSPSIPSYPGSIPRTSLPQQQPQNAPVLRPATQQNPPPQNAPVLRPATQQNPPPQNAPVLRPAPRPPVAHQTSFIPPEPTYHPVSYEARTPPEGGDQGHGGGEQHYDA